MVLWDDTILDMDFGRFLFCDAILDMDFNMIGSKSQLIGMNILFSRHTYPPKKLTSVFVSNSTSRAALQKI